MDHVWEGVQPPRTFGLKTIQAQEGKSYQRVRWGDLLRSRRYEGKWLYCPFVCSRSFASYRSEGFEGMCWVNRGGFWRRSPVSAVLVNCVGITAVFSFSGGMEGNEGELRCSKG